MADIINDGWLYLSDGTDNLKLAAARITWKRVLDSDFTSTEGGFNFGYALGVDYYIWKVGSIYFDTYAKSKDFEAYITEWHKAGTLTMQVRRNTGGDFEAFDKTNTTYKVLLVGGYDGCEKLVAENGTFYVCSKLVLRESGNRAA